MDHVPVQLEGRAEADPGILARDDVGDVDDHGLGLSSGEPDRRAGGDPGAVGAGDLDHRRDEADAGGRGGGDVDARVAPEEPAGGDEAELLRALEVGGVELELEEVGLGEAEVLTAEAREGRGVAEVLLLKLLGPVLPVAPGGLLDGGDGGDGVRVRLGEGREGEALVRVDVRARRVVHHVEAHPVEVGHLTELLGELQDELAVLVGDELVASHEDVLVVVGRDEHPRRHGQAQGRDADHVADELEGLAVPGVEERAGADQALLLLGEGVVVEHELGALLDVRLLAHDAVGPCDAHDVRVVLLADADDLGAAAQEDAPVDLARAHLDDGADALAVVLLADELQVDGAAEIPLGRDRHEVRAAHGHDVEHGAHVGIGGVDLGHHQGAAGPFDRRQRRRDRRVQREAVHGLAGAVGAAPDHVHGAVEIEVREGRDRAVGQRVRQGDGREGAARRLMEDHRGLRRRHEEIRPRVPVDVGHCGLKREAHRREELRAAVDEESSPLGVHEVDAGGASHEQVHVLVPVEVLGHAPGQRSAGERRHLRDVLPGPPREQLAARVDDRAGARVHEEPRAEVTDDEQIEISVVVVVDDLEVSDRAAHVRERHG